MQPIHITKNAAAQMKALMDKAPQGALGLRLSIKSTGCSGNSYEMQYVEYGDSLAGDDCFEENGATLYIPKIYSWMLFGAIVDYTVDKTGNARFDFQNPNEVSRCGCGESFMVRPQDDEKS